jgi:uncharacterized protein (TIGR00255 family)
MTGYGEARLQSDAVSVAVELRAVNNRYLKISIRTSEEFSRLEPEIERLLRHLIRRGTIQVQLQVRRQHAPGDYQLNTVAIRSYLEQLSVLQAENADVNSGVELGHLLALPGVVIEPSLIPTEEESNDWRLVEPVVKAALEKFQAMRREEGRYMGEQLRTLRGQITASLDKIQARAPGVVAAYRDRLQERIQLLLSSQGITLAPQDLIKEVAIFAERTDISEEVTRLGSHLEQFAAALDEPESPGRKLDFLTQEMGRETNTIGSKANDVEIARHVVEIKSAVEKIRELVQNIE